MNRLKWGRPTLALLCVAIGFVFMAEAALIQTKAWLGPILLRDAWAKTLQHGLPEKPWSWADIHPAAHLEIPSQGIDLIVLNNSSGEALTWGPGLWSTPPGNGEFAPAGHTIITGHRDTHLAFLSDIAAGETVLLTNADGNTQHFATTKTQVVDIRHDQVVPPPGDGWLLLVTCYPFAGIDPGTPERFLVWAQQVRKPVELASAGKG
ncbi:MAG: class GN sortase [Alphaproteobacteria bacterium]|nr:class GN sortase [Alphaproteobacteria bacterium SS10]